MKYLLVFLIIFLVAWRWRNMREAEHSQTQQKKNYQKKKLKQKNRKENLTKFLLLSKIKK